MTRPITLRMLDSKDVLKLPRSVKGAIYDFQHKFRRDPTAPGLRLKQLKGSKKLFSARVSDDYRAILMRAGDSDWVGLTVMHRSEVYDDIRWLEARFALTINNVTGGVEFVDVRAAESGIDARRDPVSADSALFAAYSNAQLAELGVAESLLSIIGKISTEDELLGLVEYAPRLTAEVLLALHDGRSLDEVRAEITEPQAADTPVDPEDYQEALARPATPVATSDEELRAMLEGPFSRWKVFLHPQQRRLVTRDYSGPARVSGGPGTGKTVIALHRAVHLARQVEDGRQVLVTTFTRNLASDLAAKLVELAGPEIAGRIDVVNINRLAMRVVREAEPGPAPEILSDTEAVTEWRALLREAGETRWDAEFLAAEWSQVILGQVLTSWPDYARARRAGRGKALNRSERKTVWQLAERFTKRMDERGWSTHAVMSARAALLEAERVGRSHRYRHVVVDEAQDLHPAHWKLLRAMVALGPNDIFCVGDTHQRIYDNVISLGSLGVNIRGRSTKLTLNYRITRQILASAVSLLRHETYDDLDGGTDDLVGYRSVLSGQRPNRRGFADSRSELDGVVAQLCEWGGADPEWDTLAVAAPSHELVTAVLRRLTDEGIPVVEMTASGTGGGDGVHVGTMHRFKGLEFRRLILVGVSAGLVPRRGIERWREIDPVRYRRELQRDRSLLFVAATRARDELTIFWHGEPSPFLPAVP